MTSHEDQVGQHEEALRSDEWMPLPDGFGKAQVPCSPFRPYRVVAPGLQSGLAAVGAEGGYGAFAA